MAADEILGGGVACEAGKQSVVLYDDAACATASDDQSSASNYVDVLSNPDIAAVDYFCHKAGIITAFKADSETKPGE